MNTFSLSLSSITIILLTHSLSHSSHLFSLHILLIILLIHPYSFIPLIPLIPPPQVVWCVPPPAGWASPSAGHTPSPHPSRGTSPYSTHPQHSGCLPMHRWHTSSLALSSLSLSPLSFRLSLSHSLSQSILFSRSFILSIKISLFTLYRRHTHILFQSTLLLSFTLAHSPPSVLSQLTYSFEIDSSHSCHLVHSFFFFFIFFFISLFLDK